MGSDAANMCIVAKKGGDHFVINGTKNFITNGLSGDVAVVIARTGEPGDNHGATAFILDRGIPGFKGGRKDDKLGMRTSEKPNPLWKIARCIKVRSWEKWAKDLFSP